MAVHDVPGAHATRHLARRVPGVLITRDGHDVQSAFRILGPLEVTLGERVNSPGGRRERAILAILLLNIGEVVSVERLIDGVWGEARPSSAKHMVHEYVSRLRTALAEVSQIATRPPGYMLESAGAALDVRQFRQLTTTARAEAGAERHAEALRSYDEALALWRGEALADVALEGHSQIAATRLDQERRLVGEERVDCALALGLHLQLIAELEHRVDEAPLRERSRAQLMLALYRAGHQTEALDRYRQGRTLLVEHAGLEPGRDLRELERAILTQDPVLDLAPAMHDLAALAEAITELRRRGDTIVRLNDLRLVAAAANHGRRYRPESDTDYTGFEDALKRIESAIGGTP